jgi:hypothetical protein
MRNVVTVLCAAVAIAGLAAPLASAATDDPPGTSDECTLTWVTAEAFGGGQYFGDSRLQCPIPTDTGWRWELDGVELERGTQGRLGPGEVPVFADIEVVAAPGRELCFFPQAWGNDMGKACIAT